jgi:choline dehydrogenase-like flavoprotein
VVVGTGAGGGPAAARLALAGLDVVVLESGPHLDARDFDGVEGEMFFRLGRFAATDDGSLNLYAGHCVGGSTVVNDALCWRPPPEVLALWRESHGLAPLTDEALAPFVDRVWSDVSATPTGRAHLNRNAHALERGAQRLGWAAEPMARNVRGCLSLGLCNFGCPSNAKQSTLLTYVPRALAAGARLLARTRAERVLHEAGRVRGVAATSLDPASGAPAGELTVRAPIVCLAAGVLETGALLLRSGLHGRAGHGLQFHSSVHVTARFAEPIHGYFGPTMAFAISEFADVLGQRGPGFMIENTAVHPLVTAQNLPGFGEEHERAMAALPFLAKAVVVLRDRTRGRVRLDRAGRAAFEYALLPEDLARMAEGMRATARAYLAAGALEVWLPLDGVAPVRSPAELDALAGHVPRQAELFSLYAVHLFGGAAMGGSPEQGFCNVEGEVFDVAGLFVVDAAGLPGNTGANPQITIMANALRIAEGIAARGAQT